MTEREFYFDYLKRFSLPTDAEETLGTVGEILLDRYAVVFHEILNTYFSNGFRIEELKSARENLSDQAGVSFYALNFVLLVCGAYRIRPTFLAKGYSEQLFYDTFEDLCYKARECKKFKGEWGIFVEYWYSAFFKMNLFRLGRLEYEIMPFDGDTYSAHGFTLHKGDPVISVHIPSSGPLDRESRFESYRLAYDFFGDMRSRDGKLLLYCESWLLYSRHREFLPSHLNIVDFLDDWEVVKTVDCPQFWECWRIFSVNYDGNPDNLVCTNSLQSAIAGHLKRGGCMGYGYGFRVLDGTEKNDK